MIPTTVREQVREALLSFGNALEKEISPSPGSNWTNTALKCLNPSLQELNQHTFGGSWMSWVGQWRNQRNPWNKPSLGWQAWSLQARRSEFRDRLDDLAGGFISSPKPCDIPNLMEYLFQEQGFRSPADGDQNHLFDNLLYVLRSWRRKSDCPFLHRHPGRLSRRELTSTESAFRATLCRSPLRNTACRCTMPSTKGRPLARASVMYIEEAFRRNQVPPGEMKAQVHEIVLADPSQFDRHPSSQKQAPGST